MSFFSESHTCLALASSDGGRGLGFSRGPATLGRLCGRAASVPCPSGSLSSHLLTPSETQGAPHHPSASVGPPWKHGSADAQRADGENQLPGPALTGTF